MNKFAWLLSIRAKFLRQGVAAASTFSTPKRGKAARLAGLRPKFLLMSLVVLPISAWANEPAAHSAEAKPAKAAESHAAAGEAKKPAAAPAMKSVPPQPFPEPIKMDKPVAAKAAAESAPIPVMTPPPVVRYVPPQYSPPTRQVVRSQAPKAKHSAAKPAHSTATRSQIASVRPGLVRVLPASQIPNNAVLPPFKGGIKSQSSTAAVAWGAMAEIEDTPKAEPQVPIGGRRIASPKFYTETNQDARWQYYSYP